MIRVLVASEYPMVRAGLRALLDREEDLAVVGEVAAGEELAALAGELRPDVVLLDLAADGGLAPVARLGDAAPGVSVVVLSGDPSGELAAAALDAGARAYLFKDAAREELAAAVRAVRQGLVVMHPAAALAAVAAGQQRRGGPPEAAGDALTPRELEVLALVAQGLPNKTIAGRLHLSEHTVKFHVGSIMAKLGAASRTEAVTLAARQGLIAL